jgi:molecular chaperone GrpE
MTTEPTPTNSTADNLPTEQARTQAPAASAVPASGDAPVTDGTAETAEVERLRQLLADTEQKLATVEAELHNFKLRLADVDNYRKRLLRSLEEEKKYATEQLVRDLLTAFDNLERAIEAAKSVGDNGPLAVGVTAIAAQILDILRRHGVTRIECAPGTLFDPSVHEAVAQQAAPGIPPGHITQVHHHGFRLHDRVIRPAAVVVAPSQEPTTPLSDPPPASAGAEGSH